MITSAKRVMPLVPTFDLKLANFPNIHGKHWCITDIASQLKGVLPILHLAPCIHPHNLRDLLCVIIFCTR